MLAMALAATVSISAVGATVAQEYEDYEHPY